MSRARGMREGVAGILVIGAVTLGFAINAMAVGAGPAPPPDGTAPDGGIRCHVEDGDEVILPELPQLLQDGTDGRVSSCAQLEVTKTVTGTPSASPPPGTTYAVNVDCVPVDIDGMRPTDGVEAQQLPEAQTPPFTTTLTFPASGGTQSVFIDRPSDCTVTEAPPPGCTLTSIDPVTTEIRDPIRFPVNVANNCDPAVEAAVAVVQVPRFTG